MIMSCYCTQHKLKQGSNSALSLLRPNTPNQEPAVSMLYSVTWTMYADKKWDCMKAFSQMTPDDDAKDHGKTIKMIGRYHAVGGGSGICICETDDIEALTGWMANWAAMCDIKVTPVVEDALVRKVVQNKIKQ